MDKVSKEVRSRIMRAVKSSGNRSTELRYRAALISAGLRGWSVRPAMEYKPEWVLTIDGDEILPERTCDLIRQHTFMELPGVNVLRLAIAFMWGEGHYVDTPQPFFHHRMYRATDMQLPPRLNPLKMQGAPDFNYGLHCGPLPVLKGAYRHVDIPAFIKAYGYQTREEYERHFRFYTNHDDGLWTHEDITSRLDNPLARWSENAVPRERTRDELIARYAKKMDDGIKRWEAQVEQGKSKPTQKKKVRKRQVGHKSKSKGGAASKRSQAGS